MTKLSLFDERYIDPDSQAKMRFLSDAVVWGMWPWRPRHIEMALDFEIDFNRYMFVVRTFGPGDSDLAYKFPVDAWDMADGDGWVWKAYPELVQAFRRRYSPPIPDNIILGDN